MNDPPLLVNATARNRDACADCHAVVRVVGDALVHSNPTCQRWIDLMAEGQKVKPCCFPRIQP